MLPVEGLLCPGKRCRLIILKFRVEEFGGQGHGVGGRRMKVPVFMSLLLVYSSSFSYVLFRLSYFFLLLFLLSVARKGRGNRPAARAHDHSGKKKRRK